MARNNCFMPKTLARMIIRRHVYSAGLWYRVNAKGEIWFYGPSAEEYLAGRDIYKLAVKLLKEEHEC